MTMQALLLGIALALHGAEPLQVTLSTDGGVSARAVERALTLRGLDVVRDPRLADFRVEIERTRVDNSAAFAITLHPRGATTSAVRTLRGDGLEPELLARNLALLIAENATSARRSEAPAEAAASALVASRETPPPAAPATTPPPTPAPAAFVKMSAASKDPSPWRFGVTAETGFLDEAAVRLAAMLTVGYRLGRFMFELGAGYAHGIDRTDASLWSALSSSSYAAVRSVLPGTGFVARLGASFALMRSRHVTLAVGFATELDVSNPMVIVDGAMPNFSEGLTIGVNLLPSLEARFHAGSFHPLLRFGWRQPLMPVTVDLVGQEGFSYFKSMKVEGTFVASLGVLFGR